MISNTELSEGVPSMSLPPQAFEFLRSAAGALLLEDVICWSKWYGGPEYSIPSDDIEKQLNSLFEKFPEFRSVFDYRVRGTRLAGLLKTNYPRATDLHVSVGQIGPRWRIQHGHGTYILAREIGSDFFIGHLTTVGSHRGIPKIGNNVTIRTGAVVVGPIEIGDGCMIATNAVVLKSMVAGYRAYPAQTVYVPPNSLSGQP